MAEQHGIREYFQSLKERSSHSPLFFRVIGYTKTGEFLAELRKYAAEAQRLGGYFQKGISNPSEEQIKRYYQEIGTHFSQNELEISKQITMWLGQLRQTQRITLTKATCQILSLLKQQGANDNIIKNAYVKLMCWFRFSVSRLLQGIGAENPPKLLFEGEIGKYELYLLHLLHNAGCDILYLNFTSEESYLRYDPSSHFSQPIYGDIREPMQNWTQKTAPVPAARGIPPAKPSSLPQSKIPVREIPVPINDPRKQGSGNEVTINIWSAGTDDLDSLMLPNAKRDLSATPKLCSLFLLFFGVDEILSYRNRLFFLDKKLKASSKNYLLLTQKMPNPSAAEVEPYRNINKNGSREAVILSLANQLLLNSGKVQTFLAQRALAYALDSCTETDVVRLYNFGVKLACWIKRYGEQLFEGYRAQEQPALLYYGSITEPEIFLLWCLSQMGVDILYFSPDRKSREEWQGVKLKPLWKETVYEETAGIDGFPKREERLRATTAAYKASRELDEILYQDTGMFRNRQFARSNPITLKTTYDEVSILWKEQAQYRPSFQTQEGTVYVPNLFVKICGVENGNLTDYWDMIRGHITENTYLITSIPFWDSNKPLPLTPAQASAFLHDGRLDPTALKRSPLYQYSYLPEDTQDYILEKIQALMDYDLLVCSDQNLYAVILSVLMGLNKDTLRLLQNFDFTKDIPKFIIVDVTEKVFSLEECILIAFLNQVGFDIAVFTPTGYRNLESFLRPDSFETFTAGDYMFDLSVPSLYPISGKKKSGSGDWISRLFGSKG